AQAYADFLSSHKPPDTDLVIVGYDRRFMSESFAQRAAEVLSGNGFRIAMFAEAAPTPVISWAVKDLNASGGVVITASHNPADFNVLKIKAPWGGSATPASTAVVESLVDANPVKRRAVDDTRLGSVDMAIESYRSQVSSYIDLEKLKSADGVLIVDS